MLALNRVLRKGREGCKAAAEQAGKLRDKMFSVADPVIALDPKQ